MAIKLLNKTKLDKNLGGFRDLITEYPDTVILNQKQGVRPSVMINGVKHLTVRSAKAALAKVGA